MLAAADGARRAASGAATGTWAERRCENLTWHQDCNLPRHSARLFALAGSTNGGARTPALPLPLSLCPSRRLIGRRENLVIAQQLVITVILSVTVGWMSTWFPSTFTTTSLLLFISSSCPPAPTVFLSLSLLERRTGGRNAPLHNFLPEIWSVQ